MPFLFLYLEPLCVALGMPCTLQDLWVISPGPQIPSSFCWRVPCAARPLWRKCLWGLGARNTGWTSASGALQAQSITIGRWSPHNNYLKLTQSPVRLTQQEWPGPGLHLLTRSLLECLFRAVASRSSLRAPSWLRLRELGAQAADAPTKTRSESGWQYEQRNGDEGHRLQPTRRLFRAEKGIPAGSEILRLQEGRYKGDVSSLSSQSEALRLVIGW